MADFYKLRRKEVTAALQLEEVRESEYENPDEVLELQIRKHKLRDMQIMIIWLMQTRSLCAQGMQWEHRGRHSAWRSVCPAAPKKSVGRGGVGVGRHTVHQVHYQTVRFIMMHSVYDTVRGCF